MSGFLQFCNTYKDEDSCIKALADIRWPDGFVCDTCQHDKSYHLDSRPRIYECANCGHQHSVTAGTIFHKTRTPLRKWFLASYLIGHDKRGVSALMVSTELSLRYETAWLMCHKIRHALTERDEFRLADFIEVDETFDGGRRQKGNRGRHHAGSKALIVMAVEKTLAPKGKKGYTGLDEFRHIPTVHASGAMAGGNMPIIHILFSNIKSWLNGTFHGVSTKHLPRYLREWNYRFNRRGMRG
ncbi:MAG TPA: IS1595 family transposase [Stellaceae bacterium]|nr:IS1595 family transposase [Stellaceae bacterium]